MATAPQGGHIAVIGMAGRFPGARDLAEFWTNLVGGVESIAFFSDDELLAAGVPEDVVANPRYVKAAPVVPDMDRFDAAFFDFTPREAEIRDPQHRLFLETAHAAFEDAGYDPSRHPGQVGVYGGTGANQYAELYLDDDRAEAVRALGKLAVVVGNNTDYLATTVSYKLGLRGPSVTVATACSTSLVAVHLACQALRNRECDMALAGGVEVALPPVTGYLADEGGINSPDGHCRVFDARARGTVFGSGVGAVVLKRLDEAVADRDRILVVIRGSAVNNDGSRKAGFTAPSVEGQADLVKAALADAEVDPRTVGYVEAHGTGTFVGDPIEVTALASAFRATTPDARYCAIGSVKANVGHLGAAAGAAGLIKTILAMQHGLLPPSLNFERPNPSIDFDSSPFYVNTSLASWPALPGPRRAGVSSFGIGGTNAHVVLEEPPAETASGPSRPYQLLTLSARTPAALDTRAADLAEHLRRAPAVPLADIAYTLQTGRRELEHRRAVVAADAEEAARALWSGREGRDDGAFRVRTRPVAFLFPGQGTQHLGMARELYGSEAVYREAVDRCAALLDDALGFDLRGLLLAWDDAPDRDEMAARLTRTAVAQPALFTVEYALARLWLSWGVQPDVMAGHSIGEYVAACLAGVFSLEDGLALVAARGALMQAAPEGAMLAVPIGEDGLRPLLADDLDLAAVNAPSSCVVSGPRHAVDGLADLLAAQGIEGRLLHTSHAFHSRMMGSLVGPFRDRVARTDLHPPSVPFISNVTGRPVTPEQATDPGYWAAQLRACVRFADAIPLLLENDRVLLEVGPGQTLTGLVRGSRADAGVSVVPSMRHPQQRRSDVAVLLEAVGQLWARGVPIDWDGLWAGEPRRRVALPTYPFQRDRHWVRSEPRHPLARGARRRSGGEPAGEDGPYYVPAWEETAPPAGPPGTVSAGLWLVFSDGQPVVEAVVRGLARAGGRVVTVVPGGRFGRLDPDRYSLRPGERADYDALLAALAADAGLPTRILHAWTVGGRTAGQNTLDQTRTTLELGFFSLMSIAQALTKQTKDAVAIDVLSTGMQDVTGEEAVEPAKATLLGPCKLIPKELPNIRCRSIDLPEPARDATADAERVLRELVSDSADEEVAYRGHKRWRWAYAPLELPRPAGVPTLLRERGVYLITGGLGGLGLAVAKDLARHVKARLVLVGRSPFPEHSEWDRHLAEHGEEDPVSQRITALRAIERLGGEVLVMQGDVADEGRMRAVREKIATRFGTVDGLFHAAGTAGGGMLQVRTRDDAMAVLRPKVDGTIVLDAVFGPSLDFLVLFSSIAAVSGYFGLVDYCAANAFLDAFARSRATDPTLTVAINWPPWREVGMASQAAPDRPQVIVDLEHGLSPQPVEHPLLDHRIQGDDGEVVFSTTLRLDRHWVLREHRLDGRAVLPGTAMAELVRAAFTAATGKDQVELRNLTFRRPLVVEGARRVRVRLRPAGGDAWEAAVTSPDDRADGQRPGVEYATCTVAAGDNAPAPVHDLEAIKRACGLDEVPSPRGGGGPLETGPRWNNIRCQQVGDDQELLLLELPAEFENDLSGYVLHPALLDTATSWGQILPAQAKGMYLPLTYGRLRVRRPIARRCYSHIRHRDGATAKVTTCDVTIMDEDGVELVAVEDFCLGKVDLAAVASPEGGPREPTPDGAAAAAPGSADDLDRSSISIEQGQDMLHAILAGQVRPQVIIAPEGLERRLSSDRRINQEAIEQRLAGGAGAARPPAASSDRRLDTPYVAPGTPMERALTDLWQEMLGIARVGVDDDFFELGGNSMVAVQLGVRLRERFRINIAVATLFDHPTVGRLAGAVEEILVDTLASLSEEEAAALLASIGQDR